MQEQIVQILHEEVAPRSSASMRSQTERCWKRCCPRPSISFGRVGMRCRRSLASTRRSGTPVGKWLGQPLWRLWAATEEPDTDDGIVGITSLTHRGEGQEIEREIDFFKSEHGMVHEVRSAASLRPKMPRARSAKRHAGEDFLFIVDAIRGNTVSEALAFVAAVRPSAFEVRWSRSRPLAHGLPRPSRCAPAPATSRSPRAVGDQPRRHARR